MNSRLLNTFLDAPIVRNRRDAYVSQIRILMAGKCKHPNKEPRVVRILAESLLALGRTWREITALDPSDYPALFHATPRQDPIADLPGFMSYYIAQNRELLDRLGGEYLESVLKRPLTQTCKGYLARATELLECIHEAQTNEHAGTCKFRKCHSGLLLWCHPQLSAFIYEDGRPGVFLASYEQILMLKDVALMRGNVNVLADGGELQSAVKEFLFYQEECLTRYGNKGYEVLKSCEPLTKTYLIEINDKAFSGIGGTYSSQMDKAKRKELSLNTTSTPCCDRLHRLLTTCSESTVIELFGLQKLSGHPLLDPEEGGLSAAKEARDPGLVTPQAAQDLRNNWCRLYLEGYVRKNRRWPQLYFQPRAKGTQLYRLYLARKLSLERGSYPVSNWTGVVFYQHHDMDFFPDFLDMLDDKSLSFSRSKWSSTWNRRVRPDSERRLLLEVLRTPDLSIEKIVKQISLEGFDHDDLIISLYPKEREFKLKARMFAILRLKPRLFLGTLEANIADKLFPNFEAQTMTADRDSILKRFFNTTTPRPDRLYLEIDLSRWNLRWRKEAQYQIALDMEDIFGMPRTFTRVHEFFEECMMVVRHIDTVPEDLDKLSPKEQALLWYYHCGGCEGLFQKGWTSMTYSMVDRALAKFSRKFGLTGQGDNQVLTVGLTQAEMQDPTAARKLASDIMAEIEKEALRVNQIAKPEECIASTTLITYSKDIFLNGSLRHLNLKGASRILPRAAEDFAGIGANIAGCSASGEGAASKSLYPEQMLKVTLVQSFLYLKGLKRSWIGAEADRVVGDSICSKISNPITAARLLSMPTTAGGYMSAPLSFFRRGSSDPAASTLSSLWLARNRSQLAASVLNKIRHPSTKAPYERLVVDPYAFAIDLAGSGSAAVQKKLTPIVRQRALNVDIREVLNASVTREKGEFIKTLISVVPYNPLVIRDIYANSMYGASEEIRKLFVSSRTAVGLAQSVARDQEEPEMQLNVTLTSLVTEARSIKILLNLMESSLMVPCPPIPDASLLEFASQSRKAWGLDMSTIGGWNPIDDTLSWDNYAAVGPSILFPSGVTESSAVTRGPFQPYFGYRTAQKRHTYGYKIATTGKPERSLSELATVASLSADSGFTELIRKTSLSRGIDITEVATAITKQVGGTAAHRYSSSIKDKTSSANGVEVLSTWGIIDSDNAGYLTGSPDDFPYMFQEAFAFMLAATLIRIKTGARVTRVTLSIPTSLPVIEERPMVLPDANVPDLPLVNSRLVRVPELILNATAGRLRAPTLNVTSPDLLSPLQILVSCFIRYLADMPSTLDSGIVLGKRRLPFDLSELERAGPRRVLHAASTAVALVSCTSLGKEYGWRSDLETRVQSMALAITTELTVYSAVQYQILKFLGCSSHQRLRYDTRDSPIKSAIVRDAFRLLQAKTNLVPYLTVVVTSDDEAHNVSSFLTVAMSVITVSGANEGASDKEVSESIGRTRLLDQTGSDDILGVLREFDLSLFTWSSESKESKMGKIAQQLREEKRIKQVLIPEAELIRSLRRLPPPNIALESVSDFAPAVKVDRTRTYRHALELQQEAGVLLPSLFNQSQTPSESLVVWTLLKRFIKETSVVNIGVGYGASALALLERSVSSTVIGLDLSSDLQKWCLLSRTNVPMLLEGTGYETRYMQCPAQWDTTGDCADPYVLARVVEYCSENWALVVDYIRTEQESQKFLDSLQNVSCDKSIYLKIPATLLDSALWIDEIGSKRWRILAIAERHAGGRSDALLHSDEISRERLKALTPAIDAPSAIKADFVAVHPISVKAEIYRRCSSVPTVVGTMTCRQMLLEAYQLLSSSSDRRRYEQHTQLLTLAMMHVIVSSAEPGRDLVRFGGGYPFLVEGVSVTIDQEQERRYAAYVLAPKILTLEPDITDSNR